MTTLWQDITFGCRMLFNKPGFTIAAVLSLALGIGANTTIFSIINATLLSSLPYQDPDRLMILWSTPLNRPNARGSATATQYLAWKEQGKSFESVGAWYGRPGNLGGEQNGAPAERINVALITASFWDVLGVKPMLGRLFTPDEDQDGNPAKVVVLKYDFWQRRFGGNPALLGQTIRLDGDEHTVIGIMPENFDFADSNTALWAPVGFSPQQLNSAASFLLVAGRLKNDVARERAQSELEAVSAGLRQQYPDRLRERNVRVEEIQEAFFQGLQEPLMILQGAVAFVLLIACSNVAGLLLARAASRRTEVAVRAALGAGRGRVIRQLLTESVLLALCGGVLGAMLGWGGLRLILASLPEGALPSSNISVSGAVLGYTAAISILTGLIFGVIPALQTSKVDLAASLKESGRTGMDASARQRVRQVLVTAQIALALILLIGAGLMMNSFLRLQSNNLGADPTNLLTFEFRFPQTEMMRPVGQFRGVGLWEIFPTTHLTFDRIHQRMQAIPGVISAAGISNAPFTGSMGMNFRVLGRPGAENGQGSGMGASYYAITPGYFSTMKIPLLRGRDFTESDNSTAPLVVVINKAMADRWWPNENPIGQRIVLDFVPDEQPREIVGVMGDTLQSRRQQRPNPTMFVPHSQQTMKWQGPAWNQRAQMVFVMRSAGDPNSLIPAVRSALGEIDRSKPAGNLRTVEKYLNDGISEDRVFMMLLSIFGVSAAVLAAIGIYGVMAYAVTQRTREIGIRVALGASGTNVVGLVTRQAFVLIAIGLIAGLGGAYALTRFLTRFLWQVSPTDPSTFALVSAGLVVVAVAACLVPTRRAVSVDPTIALRYE
jgi:putative ABC transport system permease protein